MFKRINENMKSNPLMWTLIFSLIFLILGFLFGYLVTYYLGVSTRGLIIISNEDVCSTIIVNSNGTGEGPCGVTKTLMFTNATGFFIENK